MGLGITISSAGNGFLYRLAEPGMENNELQVPFLNGFCADFGSA
jgi:hypothetical protein